jgi:hypothetical protein
MKNILKKASILLIMAISILFNVKLNSNDNNMSLTSISNIEALANQEGNPLPCCLPGYQPAFTGYIIDSGPEFVWGGTCKPARITKTGDARCTLW